MKVLFDQGAPVPLRRHLPKHQVSTAFEMGWAQLANGRLLAEAEGQFDALITTDKNLRYQQNLVGRKIAILVLPFTNWPRLEKFAAEIAAATDGLQAGSYIEVQEP